VAGNRGGRHRAPKPSRAPALVSIGIVLALVLAGGVVVWSTRGESASREPTDGPPASTPAASIQQATLESTRVVEVDGSIVKVSETTLVVAGGPVTVSPSERPPADGLRAIRLVVASQDGSTQPFDGPTTLTAGHSVAIDGRYRLTQCPDLIPTKWPTPTTVLHSNWSRTFTRVQEPLRTSRVLCPKSRSTAKKIRGLSGSTIRAKTPVVRLLWSGTKSATVTAVGSVSGVAAIGVSARCGRGCITKLRQGSSARVRLLPLEACPVGGKTNLLTLRLGIGNGRIRTVVINVAQLGQRVCR